MTSPWYGLGTHDRDALFAAHADKPFELAGEGWCLHVIGVPAEAVVAPAGIGRILARMAQTAECSEMCVSDPSGLHRAGKAIRIKLGIVARARHRAYVGKAFYAVDTQ